MRKLFYYWFLNSFGFEQRQIDWRGFWILSTGGRWFKSGSSRFFFFGSNPKTILKILQVSFPCDIT